MRLIQMIAQEVEAEEAEEPVVGAVVEEPGAEAEEAEVEAVVEELVVDSVLS